MAAFNPNLLFTTDYLKDHSFIDKNADDLIITQCILTAQEMHIEPLTGDNLWDDMMGEVNNYNLGSGTISSDYQELINKYLQPALTWWTMYEAVYPMTYRMTNKAVLQRTADNTQALQRPDLVALREEFKIKAEYYSERATKHLRANPTAFPKYRQVSASPIEAIHPRGTNYDTGIFTGNTWGDRKLPYWFIYQGNGYCPDGYDPDAEY